MSEKIGVYICHCGSNIAGIQAALEIADSGHPVYLVERQPTIGGHMAQFDKTFPTLDCSACILTPKMFAVGQHPNITLMTWSEVEKVEGFVGNFTVQARKRARKVNTELCNGCMFCQEKCPKKVVDDEFEVGLTTRKAIYSPLPQAVSQDQLNRVEMAFRAYDPCFGCATHSSSGEYPLDLVVYDKQGKVVAAKH